MKYLVEIDADSEKGSKAIKYIKGLDAADSQIHFINEPALTDEEMAMPPSRMVSEATLDAWLEPKDDEEGFTIEQSKLYTQKRLEELRKGKHK
jgi:hypothetical protein